MGKLFSAAHRIEIAAKPGIGLDEPGESRQRRNQIDHQRETGDPPGQQCAERFIVNLHDIPAGDQHHRTGSDEAHGETGHKGRYAQTHMNKAVDQTDDGSNQKNNRNGEPAATGQRSAELQEGQAEQHGRE